MPQLFLPEIAFGPFSRGGLDLYKVAVKRLLNRLNEPRDITYDLDRKIIGPGERRESDSVELLDKLLNPWVCLFRWRRCQLHSCAPRLKPSFDRRQHWDSAVPGVPVLHARHGQARDIVDSSVVVTKDQNH